MISLGQGIAYAVSADGSVVVGTGEYASSRAFIWDQSHGMRNLKEVLENDYGLDLTGWTLTRATGISADGLTIVGYGNNGAWIAKIAPLVMVPDVVGMLQVDAESAITSIGLVVGDLTSEYSDIFPEGYIISQEPNEGTQVEIDTQVNMVLSLGPRIPVIIYVDDDAPNGGDGTSWANAFKYLGDALDNCSAPSDILIAKGLYSPDRDTSHPGGTGDRNATFTLFKDVIIKGGFAGIGVPDSNARDINTYKTILSGDLDSNDIGDLDDPSRGENCYTVVFADGTDATAVLDGIIITAGNANYNDWFGMTPWTSSGGGVYCRWGSSLTLTNCIFAKNSTMYNGGGMFGKGTLVNCTFNGNSASQGGGMVGEGTLLNCIFSWNTAVMGGGMEAVVDSSLTLTNCTFSDNSADLYGGGIYNFDGCPLLTNCIFWGNTPDELYTDFGTPVVTYSDVQGGWSGSGNNNIDADPCFADSNNGDYHLKSQTGRWKHSIYAKLDPTGDNFIDLVDFAALARSWSQEGQAIPADLDNSGIVDMPDLKLLVDNYLMSYTRGDWVLDNVNSPCIDAGDPASDWTEELCPHGNRINMGAYGGTSQASMSIPDAR